MSAGLALAALLNTAMAGSLDCRVVGISDGDTFTCLNAGNQQTRIRLANIDTPESAQPYGKRSKQALSGWIFGKQVHIDTQTVDRYGRTVGEVHVGGTNVNAEMVRMGAAWVYRQYNRDPDLLALEQVARQEHRGLWAQPEAAIVPPWEWRLAKHKAGLVAAERAQQAPKVAGFACGEKRTCGQMSSCAEARFHLQQCGIAGLDRNKDGVPCESLCL